MIGNLTIDKASLNLSYFLFSIKLIHDSGDRISRQDFVNGMASFVGVDSTKDGGKENRTPYNKSKLARYFGFIDVETTIDGTTFLRLTNRGKKVVPLIEDDSGEEASKRFKIKSSERQLFIDLIFESVVFNSFGKNNCGAEQSNTDVEPPKILFKMLRDLSKTTSEEFCYVIFGLNRNVFSTYEEAVERVRTNRVSNYDYSAVLTSWGVANIASDCKLLNIFTDESIKLIECRRDISNRKVYYLSNALDGMHLKQIENLKAINCPLRMFVYSDCDQQTFEKWIDESILGSVSDLGFVFKDDGDGLADFLGRNEEGTFVAGLFEKALLKAYQSPKKNVYLIAKAESEEAFYDKFGDYKALLTYVFDLPSTSNGWSKNEVANSELYDFLISGCPSARSQLDFGKVKIPSNLQIIGEINMSNTAEEKEFDFDFSRSVLRDPEHAVSALPKAKGGYNKIYYGAPGCGKSYFVQHDILDGNGIAEENRFRTTFHPDYSNSDFVGQIMPKVEGEKVTYKFVPGPFALAMKKAYQTDKMVYLVIEEINRGNAAAIFGDLFQLLDRKKDPSDPEWGTSEYSITHLGLQDYLKRELGLEMHEISIPSNLTILATMNTSDQNVFTMDTAFKRRWSFEQISNDIDADAGHPYKDWFIPGTNVTWAKFLKKINDRILSVKIAESSNEDKRLGKYFVTKDCLTETAKVIGDCEAEANNFAYKVLEYLWNDVCKLEESRAMFNDGARSTLEDIIADFKERQLAIFDTDFNS